MKWDERDGCFYFNDGWRLSSDSPILGLDTDGTITYGHDSDAESKIKDGKWRDLTVEDKRELAVYMANRWLTFLNGL